MRDIVSLRRNRNKDRKEKNKKISIMSVVELGMFPGSIFGYTRRSVPLITIVHRVKRKDSVLIEKEFPCLMVSSKNPKYTILFFHGNGESLLSVYWMAKDICRTYPVRILCPEYKGYGIRPGVQTEEDAYDMARACFRFAYKKWKEPIIVAGYSIGTGMAAYLAQKYEGLLALLVMISGYSSIRAVINHRFKSCLLTNMIRDRFPNHQRLSTYKGKVVFVHGKRDRTIPIEQSRIMYRDCPSKSKLMFEIPEGHVFSLWEEYIFLPILKSKILAK